MRIISTVTIRDIAKEAKVSIATVSRVINNSDNVKEETKEIVMKVMKKLNYIPSDIARNLSKSETNMIGVVVPDINNPFFGKIIKGISAVANKEDLYMFLCDTMESEEKEMKFLKMLGGQRIKGLIITPTMDNEKFNPEYLSVLENLNIPIVLVDRDIKYSNFDGVFLDNIDAAYQAVDCLIKEGHEKIAIIAGLTTSKPGRDRLRGYKKAMVMNALEVDDQYIFYGDFKLESGYELTKKILEMQDPPTAIFVSNNMMNLGCIKALIEKNMKMPDDISLIGFDELEICNIMNINVSVVSSPMAEMGVCAMNMLLDRLKYVDSKERDAKRINLHPKLVLKGSEKKKK